MWKVLLAVRRIGHHDICELALSMSAVIGDYHRIYSLARRSWQRRAKENERGGAESV